MNPVRHFIIIILAILFCGHAFGYQQPVIDIQAKNGIIDLRNADLQQHPVSLAGDWLFNWKELIGPADNRPAQGVFPIPSLWNNKTFNGRSLSSKGFATYRLTVLLPEQRPALAIDIPDAYTSLRLYLNDRLLFESGKVADNEKDAYPHWQTGTIPLNDLSDTLRLTLQVSNFWHSKGGEREMINIGEQKTLLLERERNEAFDLLLTGCLFMGGLFFFGLYLFGKHDKAILFFSLFCMMYSYRIIGTDLYTLHSIFPNADWFVTIRLEYFTLYASIALFVQYVVSLYPDDASKKATWAMTWFCILFAATAIITPPSFFTQLINPFLVVMFVYIAYAFYIFITAVKRKRVGSIYALSSTAVVLIVFLLINLNYFGLIPPLKLIIFFGYIAFFFLQSLILSYRFATTLKIAKEQAEEGLKARSAFLSTMSHEIRTPLNSVIGTAHIMLKNRPREDQKEQLDILLFSANNLLSLVNDILDFNKIEANKVSFETIPFDLNTTVEKLVDTLKVTANEKGIALLTDLDPIAGQVTGDPMRLKQVLMNLVHNAIKFTQQGTVTVRHKVVELGNDIVRVQFSIIDTGIGIPKEKQSIIFDRFTQADPSTTRSFGGTGLGLAITKSILEQQGSSLHVISEAGKGSTFYFTLEFRKHIQPTPLVHPQKQQPIFSRPSLPLKGVNILLVEDNALNVFVAKSFLEQWGAITDVADNGQMAVEMLDENKHKLVLMDMHMPVMDGYEATATIREKGIRVPIIALTASISREAESKVLTVGANAIVIKPFDPEKLLETLSGFL